MGIDSFPLTPTTFYRQPTAPNDAIDGATWLTNSDGSGSDTSSRYQYNADADRWELNSSVGPSEPTLGTPVPGATWRDTSSGNATQYDGDAFVSLGVTDHAKLDNVTASQHHTRPNNTGNTTVVRSGKTVNESELGVSDFPLLAYSFSNPTTNTRDVYYLGGGSTTLNAGESVDFDPVRYVSGIGTNTNLTVAKIDRRHEHQI